MEKKTNVIRCRFCSWATPVWVRRKSGWGRLAQHVVDRHPTVRIRPVLVACGTTAKGIAAMNEETKP